MSSFTKRFLLVESLMYLPDTPTGANIARPGPPWSSLRPGFTQHPCRTVQFGMDAKSNGCCNNRVVQRLMRRCIVIGASAPAGGAAAGRPAGPAERAEEQ